MHGRLAAPPAAAGCLEADAIAANEARGLIALADDTQGEEIAALRDFLRSNVEAADALLAERFWSGRDVLDLVHARAWVVEQLLLLAWRDRLGEQLPAHAVPTRVVRLDELELGIEGGVPGGVVGGIIGGRDGAAIGADRKSVV